MGRGLSYLLSSKIFLHRVNENQRESARINTSPTQINTNPTQVNTSSISVNTSPTRGNMSQLDQEIIIVYRSLDGNVW